MFVALKRGFRSMASLILVRNVVGELQRTLAASRGFLAAARLSCTYMYLLTYLSSGVRVVRAILCVTVTVN